jgi:hypothetical protein
MSLVVDSAPDATFRDIGDPDAPLPEDDAVIVFVDPLIAAKAITDTVTPLSP